MRNLKKMLAVLAAGASALGTQAFVPQQRPLAAASSSASSNSSSSSVDLSNKVSGKWTFDDYLEVPDVDLTNAPSADITWNVRFTSGSQSFVGMKMLLSTFVNDQSKPVPAGTETLHYLSLDGSETLVWDAGGWDDPSYKAVDFGDIAQAIPQEMADWLRGTATPEAIVSPGTPGTSDTAGFVSGQWTINSDFAFLLPSGVQGSETWNVRFSSGGESFDAMDWASEWKDSYGNGNYMWESTLYYHYLNQSVSLYAWNSRQYWNSSSYRAVDFGGIAQAIPQEMVDWLRANAKPGTTGKIELADATPTTPTTSVTNSTSGTSGTSNTSDTAGKTELKSGANQDFYVLAGSSMTVDKILSGVSAVDLFGGQATVTVPDADKAAVDFNKAGSYILHLTAADVYGQTATATITVHVIVPDAAAPVISRIDGKDAAKASIGLSAFKAKDFAAAKAEFLGQYQAVDAVDGKVALDATGFPASLDDLKGKAGKTVQVTLTATDQAGNKATQQVELTLVADALPVFYVDSWLVATTPEQPLTPDDIKALVYAKSAAADGADIHDIEIDAGDYLAHANEPGTYAVGFQYVTPDLTLAKGTVNVMVL